MKMARKIFWVAAVSTGIYETLVSYPWWAGLRIGSYDMLMRLTVPSIFLLMFAYFLLSKGQKKYSTAMAIFVISLQLAIGVTIIASARGLLS